MPHENCGVYQGIVAAWEDDTKLAAAIELACDYHMLRTGENGEFNSLPFDLFPAEVLAVYRIRQSLGFSIPSVDHQLLAPPWTKLPDQIPFRPDPLLRELIAVIEREEPALLDGVALEA